MSPTIVVSRYVAISKDARQVVVNGLSRAAQSAQQQPGVTKYAITIPRDESDDRSCYVIEESVFPVSSQYHEYGSLMFDRYTDQAAYNSHFGSKAVADLTSLLSAGALLEIPASVSVFKATSSFTRPETSNITDPFVLIATFDYKENTRAGALDGWQDLTSAIFPTDPGTFVYTVAKDPMNADRVGSVAVYESEKYFWDTHVPNPAIGANKAKYGDIRTKTDLAYFKIVGGYLINNTTHSKL
jgi:quinol monooxygenase YgiN